MFLSVHNRCSRLAVLGELGRYPMLIPALKLCLKYHFNISRLDSSSLVSLAVSDMKNNPQLDCWLSRVEKIKSLLTIKGVCGTPERVGQIIDRSIKSKFDRFYLDEINSINWVLMDRIIISYACIINLRDHLRLNHIWLC